MLCIYIISSCYQCYIPFFARGAHRLVVKSPRCGFAPRGALRSTRGGHNFTSAISYVSTKISRRSVLVLSDVSLSFQCLNIRLYRNLMATPKIFHQWCKRAHHAESDKTGSPAFPIVVTPLLPFYSSSIIYQYWNTAN